MPIDRRRLLLGGGALLAATTASRAAFAQAPEYAVFTELSPDTKAMKPGWNRRIFTNTDSRKGNAIQCDFMVPGLFESFLESDRTMQIVLEHQSGSNPQQIYLRVFVENSKWHAMARIAVRRL